MKPEKEDNFEVINVDENDGYVKHNMLISAIYKSTAFENKLLAIALHSINNAFEDKEGSLTVSMKVSSIKEKIGISGNGIYKSLEDAAKKMVGGRSVGFSDPDTGAFAYVPLITKAEYKNGEFSLRFPPEMKVFLKDFDKGFTMLSLNTMLKFKSVYAFRLYELLRSKAYDPKKKNHIYYNTLFLIEMDLAQLKLELGVVNGELQKVKSILLETGNKSAPDYQKAVDKAEEKMYTTYAMFKRNCLDVAVKEINAKTEIQVEYEPIRTGRGGKTTAIRFKVQYMDIVDNEGNEIEERKIPTTPDEIDEFVDFVRDSVSQPIKTSEARTIAKTANYDMQIIELADAYIQKSKKQIDNYPGYMVEAIKNKWYETQNVVKKELKKSRSKKQEPVETYVNTSDSFDGEEKLTAEEVIKKMTE